MFDFKKRQRQLAVQRVLRRMGDLTHPSLPRFEGESRSDSRQNRSIPALVVPCERNAPAFGEAVYAMTKDLSDKGVSIFLAQPFHATQVVIGFWPVVHSATPLDGEPCFFLGDVKQNVDVGAGFWQVGISMMRVIEDRELITRLLPLAAHLIPRSCLDATSDAAAPMSSVR